MSVLISAQTTEATSNAFTLSGECKIIADPLTTGEHVTLLEEFPDGIYRPAVNREGIGVQLNSKQPSVIVVGYGNYKVYKSATITNVAVNLEI